MSRFRQAGPRHGGHPISPFRQRRMPDMAVVT